MHKAAAHAKRGLPLRHLPAMDLPFLVLVLTLVGFGLVMLGSASSAVALYRRGDAFYSSLNSLKKNLSQTL